MTFYRRLFMNFRSINSTLFNNMNNLNLYPIDINIVWIP